MKAHLNLLRRAKRGKLPANFDGADAAVLLELKRLGYMDAIDTTTLDEPAVMDPVITLPGATGRVRARRVGGSIPCGGIDANHPDRTAARKPGRIRTTQVGRA